ncbi:MAG: hypothetical protein U0746_13830 [Gemmataceae bacterium]
MNDMYLYAGRVAELAPATCISWTCRASVAGRRRRRHRERCAMAGQAAAALADR